MTAQKTGIKKIAYNCRKATLLIEKKQIESLTLREKLELKIHQAGCSVCRTFELQSILINNMVKQLIRDPQLIDVQLDDTAKQEMQHRIDEELNNLK